MDSITNIISDMCCPQIFPDIEVDILENRKRGTNVKEFHLTNELLLQAFWGGYMCKNNCLTRCQGYFNADTGDYGRGFIEYCIARIFNIHRVPGYEQYYLKDGKKVKMLHEYGTLNEADIDAACEEIKSLYHFVQEELKKSAYVKNGKIRLVRSLRTFEIDAVTPQLMENNSTIILPVNIMTSYAHDSELYRYGSNMSIIREVPVEKIIMFDECLFHPENVCANDIHGGEYEVWVVEDNIFGQIELDKECFRYKKLEKVRDRYSDSMRAGINASLYTDERKIIRPCEWNLFTKWLIRHNERKIKDLYGMTDE